MNRKQLETIGIIPTVIDRVIYIGTIETMPIFCKIEYKNSNLSITGVIRPTRNGDADSCGQIIDTIADNLDLIEYAKNWDKVKAYKFCTYWKKYHLNDMQAGTEKQTALIEKWTAQGNRYEYTLVCDMLKENNLYNDNGYIYGSKWLTIEIPAYVLKWLYKLPETEITQAWI